MLVLSRKVGERILIGDKIAITVVKVGHGGVRIGVEAPPELGRMHVYMLWHERSQHSGFGRWLRSLVRGVADEIRAIQRPGISMAA